MIRVLGMMSGLGLLAATPAAAATVTVSNSDALWNAVKAAAPGDVVLVASGSYPVIKLDHFVKAEPGVTIKPKAGAKAVLAGVAMDGSQGLHLSGFEVAISDAKLQYGITIYGSERIRLDRLTVHRADGAKGEQGGVGAFIRKSSDVAVTSSEFYNLGVGVSFLDDSKVAVTHSRFHDLQTDGVDFAGVVDSAADGNSFTDFYPKAGDHPDAIQFWSTKETPAGKNAIVTNNVIRRGRGGPVPMQGIFAENQENMTIRGNGLLCTMYNGISVSGTARALIEDNFVQGCTDMGTRIIARGGSSDIMVQNNQVSDRIVDLHQAGDKDNVRFAQKANSSVGTAKPSDGSALDAWLAKRTPAR